MGRHIHVRPKHIPEGCHTTAQAVACPGGASKAWVKPTKKVSPGGPTQSPSKFLGYNDDVIVVVTLSILTRPFLKVEPNCSILLSIHYLIALIAFERGAIVK